MTEFKSGPTIKFDLTKLSDCVFLFGEKTGKEMWEQANNPIVVTNPRATCVITNVDAENNTIYFGAPEGYQIKRGR